MGPIAADGTRVLTAPGHVDEFGFAPPLELWDAASGSKASFDLPEDEELLGLALSGDRALFVTSATEHFDGVLALWTATPARPAARVLRQAQNGEGQEFYEQSGDYLGNVHADGALAAFDAWTQRKGRIRAGRLWRVLGGRVALVRRQPHALFAADIDAGRIVVAERGGRAAVVRPDGRVLRVLRLPRGAGPLRLDAGRLYAQVGASLQAFDLASGRRVGAWRLQPGGAGPALEDVRSGVAAYVSGIAIHLLRLADGRDVVLDLPGEVGPAHARLEPEGLLYSYNVAWTTTPGRLGLVPAATVYASE